MLNTILGVKGKMSQTFVEGRRVATTKVLAGPCVVVAIKNFERDGYWAVQLGLGEKRIKNVTKPLQGHFKKVIKDNKAPRFISEVKFKEEPKFNIGDTIKISDIFLVGDYVSATGISKGKGFAGVVRRWHFAGGPRTHGQSDRERAPGSIGQTTTPGRVFKGKKMAGRLGGQRTTVKNLQIISINPDTDELEVSGPIPGIPGSLIVLEKIKGGKLEGIQEAVALVVEGEEAEEASATEEGKAETAKPTEETKEEQNEQS